MLGEILNDHEGSHSLTDPFYAAQLHFIQETDDTGCRGKKAKPLCVAPSASC